jgi:hypothetical protein
MESLGKGEKEKMKMLKTTVAIVLLVLSTFLVPMSMASSKADTATSGLTARDVPSTSLHVSLELSNAPALGAEANLTCLVKSELDGPKTEVKVKLPEGFALVDGDISWFGDIPANGTIEIKSVIRAAKVGTWTIEAIAKSTEISWIEDMDEIHIFVFADSAVIGVSPAPPLCERVDNPPPVDLPLPEQEIVPKTPQPNNSSNVVIQSTLTVTGRFWCYISQNSLAGHTSDTQQPMSWGWVRIKNTLGVYIGSDVSGPDSDDGEGYFTIAISNPYPLGFYVEMWPCTSACDVVKPDGSDYSSYAGPFYPSSSQTTYDVGGWRPPDLWDYMGAWRIYESIAQDHYDRGAWDFVVNEGPGLMPPMITVKFKMADGWGTYIDLNAGIIYIDTEAYSKALDVPQHEMDIGSCGPLTTTIGHQALAEHIT